MQDRNILSIRTLNKVRFADQFAGADAGAKIAAAIADLPAGGGTVDARGLEGAQTLSSTVTCNIANTKILLGASTFSGAANPQFDTTAGDCVIEGIGPGTLLTPTGVGVRVSNTAARLRDFNVSGGTVGLDLVSAGSSILESLRIFNQTTAFIRVNGDNGLELHINDVAAFRDQAGTTTTGFLITRTTTADVGAIYSTNLRIFKTAGTLTSAFHLDASAVSPSRAAVPMFFSNPVFEGTTNTVHLQNVSGGAFFANAWVQVDAGGNYPVTLDDVSEVTWIGGRLAGDTGGINGIFRLTNASADIMIASLEAIHGPVLNFGPGSFTRVHVTNVDYNGTTPTLTNNLATYQAAASRSIAPHLKVGDTNLAYVVLGDPGTPIGGATSVGVWRADAAGTAAGNFIHLMGFDGIRLRGTGGNHSAPAAVVAVSGSNFLDHNRIRATIGTALVAGDFALSAGWGATASIGTITGTDQRFRAIVTSAGAGQGANPTVILTFKDGTWTTAPFFSCSRGGGSQPTVQFEVTTVTATALTLTFQGTPVAAETYIVNCVGLG